MSIIALLMVIGASDEVAGIHALRSPSIRISVASWVRPVELRLPGAPVTAVLIFTRDETPDIAWISRFAALGSGDRVQVMAICSAPVESVRAAISRWPDGLPIGAGAVIHGVSIPDPLPRVLVFSDSGQDDLQWLPADDETLRRLAGNPVEFDPDSDRNAPIRTDHEHEPKDSEKTRELLRIARGELNSGDVHARVKAVRELRGRLPSEQLLDLCDALLKEPPSEIEGDFHKRGWWRGEVAYERHLADSRIQDKQPHLSGWQRAFAAYSQRGREDGAWWSVATYASVVASKSFSRLEQDYLEHLGDEPDEILIRDVIIQQVLRKSSPSQMKQALREWLPRETDRTLAGAIASLALDPQLRGDEAALAAVRIRLKTETDIRLSAFLEELVAELEARETSRP